MCVRFVAQTCLSLQLSSQYRKEVRSGCNQNRKTSQQGLFGRGIRDLHQTRWNPWFPDNDLVWQDDIYTTWKAEREVALLYFSARISVVQPLRPLFWQQQKILLEVRPDVISTNGAFVYCVLSFLTLRLIV